MTFISYYLNKIRRAPSSRDQSRGVTFSSRSRCKPSHVTSRFPIAPAVAIISSSYRARRDSRTRRRDESREGSSSRCGPALRSSRAQPIFTVSCAKLSHDSRVTHSLDSHPFTRVCLFGQRLFPCHPFVSAPWETRLS